MRRWNLSHEAISSYVTAALLAGCAGPRSLIAEPATMPQSRGSSPLTPRSGSWILPQAKSEDLLYVSDFSEGQLQVFSYPRGKLVGTISGLSGPMGLCADTAGDIFVANAGGNDVLEYAHGGSSPIKTLSDMGYAPEKCSSDPMTGNLAVVDGSSSSGSVAVFKHASGTPVRYANPRAWRTAIGCGYDDAGNLLVSGRKRNYYAALAELKYGRRQLNDLSLGHDTDDNAFKISNPGQVQWDGSHVAVFANLNHSHQVYQFTIDSGSATVVNITSLEGGSEMRDTWIQGNTIVAAGNQHAVWFFTYPAGGHATKTLDLSGLGIGVAISTP